MRVLEAHGIPYKQYEYDDSDNMIDGVTVANMIGEDPGRVFKTLVTVSKARVNYVFVLPVNKELDLKKAAKAVNEKSIEMIPVKEIEPVTGYIKGGCSPVGMKKQFKTAVDEKARNFERIVVSAGKVGLQMDLPLESLLEAASATITDLVIE
jgi:Cys-tRNA(Pro)/Cys-tRNA(Cys) deacylase